MTADWRPQVEIIFVKQKGKERKKQIIDIEEFINVKGPKAMGNKLTSKNIKEINLLEPLPFIENNEAIKNKENLIEDIDFNEERNDGQITLEL